MPPHQPRGAGDSLGPAHYVFDMPRFAALVRRAAPLLRLAGGCSWAEGPVWFGDHGCLLWSDIPADRMLRWSEADGVSVFRQPSHFANGHARDRQGRLVSCEHGTRRVTRTEHDGTIRVLADAFEGKRLNSPNDVIVGPDGAVWFTDPTYGIDSDHEGHRAEPEYGGCHVFRIDPTTRRLAVVSDDFVRPNGLALSDDARLLYVVDTGGTHVENGPRHIRALTLDAAGQVVASRLFATIDVGFPDGIALDDAGRLWCSAGDGVQCFDPDGTRLGRILLPEAASNVCFGGARGNQLFVTASESLYKISLAVRGAAWK